MFRRGSQKPDRQVQHSNQSQPIPQRRSIVAHLRWSYVISSTLPLILVGTLLIFLNFRAQQKNVYNEQVAVSMQTVRSISNYIADIETRLLGTGRYLRPDTFRDQRNAVLEDVIDVQFPNLRDISVFNVNRSEISHVSLEKVFSPDTYVRRTNDPMVLAALQGTGSRSDIYTVDEGNLVFTIALPLRNDNHQIIGAIRAEVSATPIRQALRMPGRDSSNVAYLLNDQHDVILEARVPDWKPPPELGMMLTNETGQVEYQNNSMVLIYPNGQGKTVLGIVSPIRPGTWSLVLEQPLSVAFGNVWNTMILLAILVAVVGLVALGVALLLSQRIIRPLRQLHEGASALGFGHLDHRIALKSEDEMGKLANALNLMAERLKASLSEIEQQNVRLREGLNLARDIQVGLLPTQPPWNHEVLSVYARSMPASEVGGDFYSYLSLPNGQAAISIGDISGKGVGAALMMALTTSMVESQSRQCTMPSEVLMGLNRLLYPRLHTNGMNSAVLYAVFDLQAHMMTVANAGMIAPFLIRRRFVEPDQEDGIHTTHGLNSTPGLVASSVEMIEVGGLPVGSMKQALYNDVSIDLEPGDIILFMSDGVIEAHNQEGEMFGFDRLEAFLAQLHTYSDVHELVDMLVQAVYEFMGQAEQHDDITIVAVRPVTSRDFSASWTLTDSSVVSSAVN